MDCQDVGKVSKTVPFDKITDCDVEEPAGASGPCCCLVQNVLVSVRKQFDHCVGEKLADLSFAEFASTKSMSILLAATEELGKVTNSASKGYEHLFNSRKTFGA